MAVFTEKCWRADTQDFRTLVQFVTDTEYTAKSLSPSKANSYSFVASGIVTHTQLDSNLPVAFQGMIPTISLNYTYTTSLFYTYMDNQQTTSLY